MDEIVINEADTGKGRAPEKIRDKKIRTIAEALIDGKVLILPTSTIYGISCRYDDAGALSRIYKIKRRRPDMPFIILISDTVQLEILVEDINITVKKLMERYWKIRNPQPLTLILNKREGLTGHITAGSQTVAVRMAGLKVIRDIIDLSGPIVSTSATISGIKTNPKTISDIPSNIREKVDMTVRLKDTLKGTESTIIDITGSEPVLVREGAIGFEKILEYLKAAPQQ